MPRAEPVETMGPTGEETVRVVGNAATGPIAIDVAAAMRGGASSMARDGRSRSSGPGARPPAALEEGHRAAGHGDMSASSLCRARGPVACIINGLGDRIYCLPALRALASCFQGRLRLVCSMGDGKLFFRELGLDQYIEISSQFDQSLREPVFDAGDFLDRVGDCDLFISLNTWHGRSLDGLMACLPASCKTLGYFNNFNINLSYENLHRFDLMFRTPASLDGGLSIGDFSYPPRLSPDCTSFARRVRSLVQGPSKILAVQTRTRTLFEKSWPYRRFREVFDGFLSLHPDFLVYVIDEEAPPDDAARNDRIVPIRVPLGAAMALVSVADLFLGIDSWLLHVADLCRIPSVGLFGPTDCSRFGVHFAAHRHVKVDGPMELIRVPRVQDALESLLAEVAGIPRPAN